ncbi:MAG: hypothetical protein U0359_35230 [Byssovorax sp.]
MPQGLGTGLPGLGAISRYRVDGGPPASISEDVSSSFGGAGRDEGREPRGGGGVLRTAGARTFEVGELSAGGGTEDAGRGTGVGMAVTLVQHGLCHARRLLRASGG